MKKGGLQSAFFVLLYLHKLQRLHAVAGTTATCFFFLNGTLRIHFLTTFAAVIVCTDALRASPWQQIINTNKKIEIK
ncbi:MAG: hypothetical protein J5516_05610 [Bacteroidales bacterium]|nr:hypothetical protein [Bacteroidales bacterium]